MIVTDAEADFIGSAALVAVMVALPVVAGAVKTPAEEIVPAEAVHVTAVFVMVPCIDAMKGTEPPAATLTEFGEMRMESTMGTDGAGGVAVEDGDAAVALYGTTTGSVTVA
jgi:hypothetical protein